MDHQYFNVCRMIDKYNVISFDIYDTALLRNVLDPTDIFDLVSKSLEKENIKLINFKKMRIDAEEIARRVSLNEDVTHEEIFEIISKKIGRDLAEIVKQKELALERQFTIANPFIKKVYNYARSKKKRIIFISDMYLSDIFITNLLKENGYEGFEKVYISGIVGKSKAMVSLFHHIKEDMQIVTPWLHIGDNLKSDYENAKKSGIDAFYYQRHTVRNKLSKKLSLERSIIKAIQLNKSETEKTNYWEEFGITTVSSIFFGFTMWLAERIKNKNNVYFLSRDGYLPFLIYQKVFPYIQGLPKPKYLFASRRAYQIPNLLNMSKSEALEILTTFNIDLGQNLSLGEIFENLNLEHSKYLELIRNFGFPDFNYVLKTKRDVSNAKELLDRIFPDIKSNLEKELEILKIYLKENGIYDQSEVNVVDIGWRGSTQKAIMDITNIPTIGYYLGTTYNVYEDIIDKVNGYAFNLGKPNRNKKRIMDNVMMYELIFSASHGTLIGFNFENERISPVLSESENDAVNNCLSYIHNGILKITDEYLKYFDYIKTISMEDCLEDYFNFIEEKRYEDLAEFSKLRNVVGIGKSEIKQNYVSEVTIKEYLINKQQINQQISKNLWKNALIIKGSISDLHLLKKYRRTTINLINADLKRKIIKAIRNPKKVLYFIRRKVKSYYFIRN